MPDVFISYAHEDNDWPTYGSEGGWVQCFYNALNRRLNNLRRGTVVFLDESGGITGASSLNDTIRQALTNCPVLVTIVSPTYLASDWCAKELQFFRDAATKGGLTVATEKRGQLARVMKAIKIPVAHSDLKQIAAETDAVGYQFWQDDGKGSPIELVAPHGDVDGTDFCRAINTLATDIAAVLQALATGGNGAAAAATQAQAVAATPVVAKANGPLIYLAETTSDLSDARERMRQELEQYGCTVIPATQQFPGPNYGDQVKGNLTGARLSIHPVGKSYGMIPEGVDESIVALQYRLAVEHSNDDAAFTRLVWMPPGVEPADERQARFVSALQDDPALKVTSLEDFKTLVHDTLTPPVSDQVPVATDGTRRSVYLIFNELDAQTAFTVNSYLTKCGFKVWTPTSDEKDRLQLRAHQKRLKLSQGVLIYYGLANDRWVQNVQMILAQDFVTAGANTRARCVVLADPEDDDKKRFTDPEFRIVNCFGGFEPQRLEGFLRDMEAPPASA